MPPNSSNRSGIQSRDVSPPRESRRRKALYAHTASLPATFATLKRFTLWVSLSPTIQPSSFECTLLSSLAVSQLLLYHPNPYSPYIYTTFSPTWLLWLGRTAKQRKAYVVALMALHFVVFASRVCCLADKETPTMALPARHNKGASFLLAVPSLLRLGVEPAQLHCVM